MTSPRSSPDKPAASCASNDSKAKLKWLQDGLTFATVLNCSAFFLGAAGFLVLEMIFMVKTGGARQAMNLIRTEYAHNHPLRIVGFFGCIPMQVALTALQRKLELSTKRLVTGPGVGREFGWNLIWAVPVVLVSLMLYLPFWVLWRVSRLAFSAKSRSPSARAKIPD